jgi:hypothetical protein
VRLLHGQFVTRRGFVVGRFSRSPPGRERGRDEGEQNER